MILSDSKILEEIDNGNIIIEPFIKEHLNPNSVDLTLDNKLVTYAETFVIVDYYTHLPEWVKKSGLYERHLNSEGKFHYYSYKEPLDVKQDHETLEHIIPEEGFVLIPGKIYLAACNEKVGVKGNICADIVCKSSLGRLGLDIIIGPAGHTDTGFEGSMVLELRCTEPIRIYPNMKICKIKYSRVEGQVLESYNVKKGSKYMNQEGVQHSLYFKNFE